MIAVFLFLAKNTFAEGHARKGVPGKDA